MTGASDECFFLRDSGPLSRHHVEPDISRIVLKPLTRLYQLAQAVVINFTARQFKQSLLRKTQPVSSRDSSFQIETKPRLKERSDSVDIDHGVHWTTRDPNWMAHAVRFRFAEIGRVAFERVGKFLGQDLTHLVPPFRRISFTQKQQDARAPVVITRNRGVKAKHLRTPAD